MTIDRGIVLVPSLLKNKTTYNIVSFSTNELNLKLLLHQSTPFCSVFITAMLLVPGTSTIPMQVISLGQVYLIDTNMIDQTHAFCRLS